MLTKDKPEKTRKTKKPKTDIKNDINVVLRNHFNKQTGNMQINFLWTEQNKSYYRINWIDTSVIGSADYIDSSFVIVDHKTKKFKIQEIK